MRSHCFIRNLPCLVVVLLLAKIPCYNHLAAAALYLLCVLLISVMVNAPEMASCYYTKWPKKVILPFYEGTDLE